MNIKLILFCLLTLIVNDGFSYGGFKEEDLTNPSSYASTPTEGMLRLAANIEYRRLKNSMKDLNKAIKKSKKTYKEELIHNEQKLANEKKQEEIQLKKAIKASEESYCQEDLPRQKASLENWEPNSENVRKAGKIIMGFKRKIKIHFL